MLPVPSKSTRIKISSQTPKKKEKTKKKKTNTITPINQIPRETRFFAPISNNNKVSNNLDLQEIPNVESQSSQFAESLRPSNNNAINLEKVNLSKIPSVISVKTNKKNSTFLQEISPKPYGGSLIASKEVYGPPKNKTEKKPQIKQLKPISAANSIAEDKVPQDHSDIKRKQLEEDMSEVLSILSKKLSLPKEEKPISKSIKNKDSKKKIPPANMNEILKQLLNLDLQIEASAILKGEKVLASAISSRISETLLTTIGQNLNMIGSDIINGLSAGKLKLISIKGTDGVLDLAPIDLENSTMKDMILIELLFCYDYHLY